MLTPWTAKPAFLNQNLKQVKTNTNLREFVLTTVILPPSVGNTGICSAHLDAFLVGRVDLVNPVQNSGAIWKHPSRRFGRFGRKRGTHFEHFVKLT